MWKVNAGRRSVFAGDFLSRNIVAIGWTEAGDYTGVSSKDELFTCIKAAYPDRTERQNEVGATICAVQISPRPKIQCRFHRILLSVRSLRLKRRRARSC